MKNKLFVILALALVFIAVTMLAATIQYSSGLIGVKNQSQNVLGSDLNFTGPSNRSDSGAGANNNDISGGGNSPNLDLSKFPSLNDVLRSAGGLPDPKNPPDYLLLLILLILLLLIALIGYYIWRRLRRKPAAPVDELPVEPEPALEYFEGDFALSFPGISAPFPVIWGIKERLELVIHDKTGMNGAAILYIDGEAKGELTMENGQAHVELDLEKGDHRVMVSPRSIAEGSSWADVRIVDYREEVVKIFNELYRSYRSGRHEAKEEMTAREMEMAMRPNIPEPMQQKLGDTVMIFEYANYSLHDIRRKEYETMYLSRMGLAQTAGGKNVE